MPRTILRMDGEPLLVINHAPKRKGLLVTLLRIFDDQGEIIARLDHDEVWVKNSTRSKRPNSSTLVVYDQHDQEVLHLELLNRTTLVVRGIFRKPGQLPFVVTAERAL